MKFQVLNSTDSEIQLVVEGASEALMNLIRRSVSFEVPTFAVEEVYFKENTAALYDEILAHRIGLVPLKVDKGIFGMKDPKVELTLIAEGPKEVTAADLNVSGKGVEVLYPNTPLTKISKNQRVELRAVAIPGTGKDHVKWSAGHAYYFHYPSKAKGNENLETLRKMIDAEEIATLKNQPNKFIFVIESWGQLEPKEMLKQALDKVGANLSELKVK
jgi:DNA-directed RNA polymerase alpha subunit